MSTKYVMKYIIFSYGRCGTTLLTDLIGAHLFNKEFPGSKADHFNRPDFVIFDKQNSKEKLEQARVIHTHTLNNRFDEMKKTRTVIYCVRRDIRETIASLRIAEHSRIYNHFTNPKANDDITRWQRKVPKNLLNLTDTRVKKLVDAIHGLIDDYHVNLKQNPNSHLLFFEDWITNFKNIPVENFNYNLECNYKFSKKIPIVKEDWVDYDHLANQIRKFNNGSLELKLP
jgi:hypothetical protein